MHKLIIDFHRGKSISNPAFITHPDQESKALLLTSKAWHALTVSLRMRKISLSLIMCEHACGSSEHACGSGTHEVTGGSRADANLYWHSQEGSKVIKC